VLIGSICRCLINAGDPQESAKAVVTYLKEIFSTRPGFRVYEFDGIRRLLSHREKDKILTRQCIGN